MIVATLILLGFVGTGLAAQSGQRAFDEKAVANFYGGKSVRVIVGFSSGGGYDQYSA
jgi:hypothetical protein